MAARSPSSASTGAEAPTGLDAVVSRLEEQRRAHRAVMSTSADRAARVLREQVVDGVLRSGTRLPEERLATAIGVSRNTLREALSQLVAERVLVREPHRGVVVATPTAEDVVDVYRARLILEPGALRSADLDRDDLRASVDRAVAEGRDAVERGDWLAVGSANQHFHRAVVALVGSARLDAQMDLLLAEMRLIIHRVAADAEGLRTFHEPFLEENGIIADHLAAGDRESAARRMTHYLRAAERLLVSSLAD